MHSKSKAKKNFQQNIDDIQGFKATTMPKRVVLVNKPFHDDLVNWLTQKKAKSPKNLDTESLFTQSKGEFNLKRGVDYEIISSNLWNDIIKKFGSKPKIEAILIKNPQTNEESILLLNSNCLIFNIYLPKQLPGSNLYSVSNMSVQYYSHLNWPLQDVKKQICKNYQFDPMLFSFTQHDKNERIPENLTMNQVSTKYKNDLDLKQNKLNQSQSSAKKVPNPSNIQKSPSSLRMHKNPSSSSSLLLTDRRSVSRKVTKTVKTDYSQPPKTATTMSPSYAASAHQKCSTEPTSTEKTAQGTQKVPRSQNSMARQTMAKGSSLCPIPVGLNNLGNTCFFNASVQCLARVMPLTRFILSDSFSSQLNPSNVKSSHGTIANAYRHFLEGMCRGGGTARDPSELRRAIVSKYRRFANFGQHDSQELLCSLLDGLHEDLNQSASAHGHCKPVCITKDSDSWDVFLSRNSSPICDIFYGILYSSISCPSCGYIEKVRDPFVFLSVEIPRKFSAVRLESCLQKFSQKETLDMKNKWRCEKCKKMVCATKEIGVEKCGDHALIIHLKRFSGEGRFSSKVDTAVEYPDVLDASSFANDDDGKFRLIGAVFHSGGLGGGHYTAAAIDPASNAWYSFNDSSARRIDKSSAHSRGAYILFYERIY